MEDLQHLLTLAAIAVQLTTAAFLSIAFPLYAWKRSSTPKSIFSPAIAVSKDPIFAACPIEQPSNADQKLKFVRSFCSIAPADPIEQTPLPDRTEWQPLPISAPTTTQPVKRKRGRPRKVA